jgi:hypothetical protein
MSLVPLPSFLDFARNDKEWHRLDEFAVSEVIDSSRFGAHGLKIVSG